MNVLFIPFFGFWSLLATKLQKYYVIFAYILQDGKIGKKTTQLKWQKYQKPKDETMGWMKQKSNKKEDVYLINLFIKLFFSIYL
jgi:hypothetical protein